MAKTKDTPHLRLRVDPSLLARLEKAAEKNGRTLTGEINHRLGQSFTKDDLMALAERLSERISGEVTVKIEDVITKIGRPREDKQ
jgi:Arc-like DNA binding domain